jgi:predicted adenine nucleotide alpha hydrolase (AANH) superfamily ATPase
MEKFLALAFAAEYGVFLQVNESERSELLIEKLSFQYKNSVRFINQPKDLLMKRTTEKKSRLKLCYDFALIPNNGCQ